ncbi:hypothetical protein EVAR_37637_1 [Eumeta japonica]|uniref:Uncharacterized protein n=1 Tax=Eumeta variegata TaxID=151549 RepID=A0A4C1VMB8_EUMVA|nr:hypothetical protein EVAR_37637_1 [Eumeta japonica]
MEDVYSIKVKTKPDTRNLYPSERRYSASTVSGLAWVHIALAATSFLLACLALVNPGHAVHHLKLDETRQKLVDPRTYLEESLETTTEYDAVENIEEYVDKTEGYSWIIVLAPTMVTVFALSAGIASIMASIRWYVDRNITWLFVMSILSTIFSLTAFIMVTGWFISTSDSSEISEFYKDKIPFNDYIIVKQSDIVVKNDSHILISNNGTSLQQINSHAFTKRVLSINILIASFLELLWSILSIKISYKGMKNNYREEDDRRGNCISVVTTIKGNNTKKLPRNAKILPPKPDLIDHYPDKKLKRIYLVQGDTGFYLKNQNNDKAKPSTETSSEFHKERMMNFLNRCASFDGISTTTRTPSIQSEPALNPIPEVDSVDINIENVPDDSMTRVSWGDTPEHTIYNQNNLNLDKIFQMRKLNSENTDVNNHYEEISENVQQN